MSRIFTYDFVLIIIVIILVFVIVIILIIIVTRHSSINQNFVCVFMLTHVGDRKCNRICVCMHLYIN